MPIVLKTLSQDFEQSVVFRIGPKVRVEPGQLIRCTSTNRVTENRLVRIQNRELFQEFFGFSQGVSLFEDNVATNGSRYGGDEFNNRWMRQAHRVLEDAASENLGCNLLLVSEAMIEPVNQNVGINESGHARRDPLAASLFREAAWSDAPMNARGDAPSLGRTNGAGTRDFQASPERPEE